MADVNAAQENIASRISTEQLRNAELLLAYASETGITLPRETIENIIRLKHFSDSGQPAPDPVAMETSFLQATEALAKAVSPVTVASLRASYDKQDDTSLTGHFRSKILRSPRLVSQAALSVRRFRFWALGTLILLLVVQTYWVVGSSVTTDVTTTLDQVEKDRSQQALLRRESEAIEEKIREYQGGRSGRATAPAVDVGQLEAEHARKLNELTTVDARLKNYEQSTELNFEILNNWNEYWRRPIRFFGRLIGSRPLEDSGNEGADDPYLPLLKSLKTAQFAIYSLQIYLLPILYGLLGAITYVLRTLAVQIRSLTYTPESDICLRLRMNLGALSGLAIVWFIKEGDSQLPFASLSQFAIAFIAGYSVELLFAAMDRFISAFSDSSKETG
ncbi:MAG: hypothetical protein C4531_13870 [Desulfurivibrio sp.]|jgi:cell division protein FtsB|nr:MAG: hypothetical protein C4531_13870 [Desulfurivibrio sp.]